MAASGALAGRYAGEIAPAYRSAALTERLATLPELLAAPAASLITTGRNRNLRALVGEADLPDGVELVWHGVNDRANLRHFLGSPVRWGECDVRRDPQGRLALRHDPFEGPVGPCPDNRMARPQDFAWPSHIKAMHEEALGTKREAVAAKAEAEANGFKVTA